MYGAIEAMKNGSIIRRYWYKNIHMKTIIQIHKQGKYFVAADLITNVADQGLT